MAICMSNLKLDWQLLSVGATQGLAGENTIGSIRNAHADFQAALKEIDGTQSQALVSNPDNISNPRNLPKAS